MEVQRWHQILSVIVVLYGLVLPIAGQKRYDDIYEKYCSQGFDGYGKFRLEVFGIRKMEFWNAFVNKESSQKNVPIISEIS